MRILQRGANRMEEAVTNWESGRFAVTDLRWALGKLRESSRIVGGDICGAYSPPHYARWKQRFAAEFDRPKLVPPDLEKARATNLAALQKLWPLLLGTCLPAAIAKLVRATFQPADALCRLPAAN